MNIFYCSNNKDFEKGRAFQPTVSSIYPGASWLPIFHERVLSKGISLFTADIGFELIQAGRIDIRSVRLLTEDICTKAEFLLKAGAKGGVSFCMESPMFAANYYINAGTSVADYPNCFTFNPRLFDGVKGVEVHRLRFPSFSLKDEYVYTNASTQKNKVVLVAQNKYGYNPSFSSLLKRVAKSCFGYADKRRNSRFSKCELHSARIKFMSCLSQHNFIDVYGKDWENRSVLPKKLSEMLQSMPRSVFFGHCDDKKKILSDYNFTLCFENMEYPGYVTEKIFDAICAGSVPIYFGAPDISDFIPDSAFIDVRKFSSFEDCVAYITSLSLQDVCRIVDCGRNFITSDEGRRFSYEHFSDELLECFLRH